MVLEKDFLKKLKKDKDLIVCINGKECCGMSAYSFKIMEEISNDVRSL